MNPLKNPGPSRSLEEFVGFSGRDVSGVRRRGGPARDRLPGATLRLLRRRAGTRRRALGQLLHQGPVPGDQFDPFPFPFFTKFT